MAHKSGFVNIVGNPNVGKSTLVNNLMGGKLSIITPKAQTTRHRIKGILNDEDYQIVLSDTPGVIKPVYAMQNQMMEYVHGALEDADALIYMVEIGEKELKDQDLFQKILRFQGPLLLIINKIDKSNQEDVENAVTYWAEKVPNAEILPISALHKVNTNFIIDKLLSYLPEGPAYFSKDSFTDKSERFFVNENVREKILQLYDKEIPYVVEVETDEFKEQDNIIRIRTNIYVERESQKNILIGPNGSGIKRIGTQARKDLEAFFGKQIYLELFVKVLKNWRNNKNNLNRFGYN